MFFRARYGISRKVSRFAHDIPRKTSRKVSRFAHDVSFRARCGSSRTTFRARHSAQGVSFRARHFVQDNYNCFVGCKY